MKKLFTKCCLLAIAMVMGGAISANAQIVTWGMDSKASYTGGQELSSNTAIVSVKLGNGTWSYNATWGVEATPDNAAPTMTDNLPSAGNYIVIKPTVDVDFSMDVRASTNHNFKVVESAAPSTNVFYLRGRYYLTYTIGTLKAGKTYYAYSEGGASLGYRAFTAKSIETLTIKYQDAEGNTIKSDVQRTDVYGTVTTATEAEMAPVDVDGDTYVYLSGNTNVTLGTTNTITLVYEKSAAASTTYTIKYELSDGTAIADPIQHDGLVGDENVTAANAEVLPYITKAGVKYKYVSGNTPITLVEDENSNIITLVYAEAPKYVGKVIAVDNSENVLGEIATLPAVYEGDSYTYGFPQYYLNGTTLYNVANNGTGDWYRNAVSPVADNYEVKIKYNGASVANVAFYSEAENIPAVSVANYTNRASNGQVAHTGGSETYKNVTTVAPGKYQIYVKGLNGNKDARACNFKIGDDVVYSFSITQGTNQLGNSEEFTVSAESTLQFASEGSSASGVDWFYLVKTGDVYTKTLGTTGFGTFAAACNVTVPAGVVVYNTTFDGETLTATPSEEISVIPANTGVIFKAEAGAEVKFVATGEEASSVETALTAAVNGVDGDSSTIFGLLKNENTFAKVMSGVTLANNSAYLEISASSGKGAINFVVDEDNTTAVAGVAEAKAEAKVVKFVKGGQILIQTANGIINAAAAQVK